MTTLMMTGQFFNSYKPINCSRNCIYDWLGYGVHIKCIIMNTYSYPTLTISSSASPPHSPFFNFLHPRWVLTHLWLLPWPPIPFNLPLELLIKLSLLTWSSIDNPLINLLHPYSKQFAKFYTQYNLPCFCCCCFQGPRTRGHLDLQVACDFCVVGTDWSTFFRCHAS